MEGSNLAKIDEYPKNPMDLFKSYLEQYEKFNELGGRFMNIATIDSSSTTPLNRTVVLRQFDDDAIYFVTQRDSRKYLNIMRNPKVSVIFLWCYRDELGKVYRQVRINGTAHEQNANEIKKFYDEEPLFAKIRSKICKINEPIDWDDLKVNHDKVLRDYQKGEDLLPINDLYTSLKIEIKDIEFYHARWEEIADRILYTREGSDWKCIHIQA